MYTNAPRCGKISFQQKITLIIFGIFLALILIETGLRLGGFIILSLQERRNRASLMRKDEYRILCLGESTTQGQYPSFLEETLNRRNTGIKFSVIDKGIQGIDTPIILSRLESYLDTYHPDIVITMMGINDAVVPHIPYATISDSRVINYLKSFRTYKLTRLLWLHIVNRLKELQLEPFLRKTELRQVYVKQKDVSPNEKLLKLKNVVQLAPGNTMACLELGRFYREQGKFFEAEGLFKKVIELDPGNEWAYIELGWLYQKQDRSSAAEELFKKAIELDPGNYGTHFELGRFYQKQDRSSAAEEPFRKAIELDPQNDKAYIELGWVYLEQNKFSEARELFRKTIELDPGKDRAYGALEVLCIEMGNAALGRGYANQARHLRLNYYSPITISNYHKLKSILDKRGVAYVCAQYPMRNIEPLRKIFQGGDNGIIFVDNEKIFKDAVMKYRYRDYFTDMFGGDFGHCTEKGNWLLAENIADAIVKEVFSK